MIYFLLSLIPILINLFVKTTKTLQVFQQNRYNDNKWYIKWLADNPNKIFLNIDLLYIFVFLLGFLSSNILKIISTIFGLIVLIVYVKIRKNEQIKKPLVYTKRVKRLIITFTLIHGLLIFLLCYFYVPELISWYYLIIGLLVYFNYYVIYLVGLINKPIEKMYNIYYKDKAIKKLDSMDHMEVIGITGSYGKTSSKNILSDILNIRYNAFPTPLNYNTEMGLVNTINNHLDKFSDYFIAEMGALNKNDIKKYCDFVKPKYGILTVIGEAHLETFGSIENIQKGKFALIESLPKDGIGILNGDDERQWNYKFDHECRLIWIGIDNKDVDLYADKIKMTKNGMTFTCYFKGDKKGHEFETSLLGKANIYNILAAIALGKELGISIDDLKRGVRKVKPVEHRLELKKIGDIILIDDAYNSNPVGSKMALDVLNLMDGKKIIVTPGMIELGEKQEELNHKFGTYIADVCDEVILVGRDQTRPIYEGLLEKNYPVNNIHTINDVKESFVMLEKLKDKKTIVLLENDLPDIFSERR